MLTARMRQGFTLIELAIVIVILGLIVGGVLVAQDMIAATQLRKLGTQIESYKLAIHTFKGKYNALPGDIPNATAFWGEVSSGCTTQAGTGTQTCNGNGNSAIGNVLTGENYEIFRFWQHLANAGLIDSTYSGVPGAGSIRDAVAGVNVPSVSYAQSAGFSILSADSATINSYLTYYFPAQAGTSFTIGTKPSAPYDVYELLGPFLSGLQAYDVDLKYDDGKAGQGHMFGSPNSSSFGVQCATTNDPATAEYTRSDAIKRCHLNVKFI